MGSIDRRRRGIAARVRKIGWLVRVCLLACLLIGVSPAQAIMREIDPGDMPRLGADDGLLLIGVDTDVDLTAVRISRQGLNLDMRTLRGVKIGRSQRLYAVPAGRYRWASVDYVGEFRLSKDPEFGFEVKPGVINYPGDLVFRSTGWLSAIVHVSNRGLRAMDGLQADHAALFAAQRFTYTGHYPDPFPEFYRQAITAAGHPAEDKTVASPEPGPLSLSLRELWWPSRVQMIELNPRGDLYAEAVLFRKPVARKEKNGAGERGGEAKAEDEPDWRWAIDLVDLKQDKVVRLFESPKPVSRLDWADDRSLIMSIGGAREPDALVIANVIDDPQGRRYDKVIVPRVGALVKVLDNEPGHILFASVSGSSVAVHKLDVRTQAAMKRFDFTSSPRYDRGIVDGRAFFADAAGRIRLAITVDKTGKRVLVHGGDGVFRKVLTLDEDTDFEPMALSADGALVYGTAERDRGQRELVEFDPATAQITRTVFSKPGRDVIRPVMSVKGELIGASYYENGLLYTQYFRDADATLYRRLNAAFPGRSATILQATPDRRKFLVGVGGSDKPMDVYFFDADAKTASLVSETMPWLSSRTFAPATALRAKSRDGFEIEAYLTLPPGAKGKVPLVLFPHGGPIGVRNDRYFDPEVQIIASLGYAVLQVNFRGSEGFGTAFRKAGERSYGTAIEDDIDAALAAALAQYPLDPDRICAVGASYGGYSAMVTAIRWPGRLKCVVSMAGISDRALFFTASDSARSEEGRKLMERVIGDPNADMAEMQRNSPLYRYKELTLPILLVHGREDLRVDYEHTRRLVRMLNLAGRPPALIALDDEGHGFDTDVDKTRVWSAVAGFLRAHLGNTPAPVTAPAH